MKRALKILAIILAVPLLLFAIAATVLVTLDVNEYREPIAQRISEATGRQIVIAGELEKSFFPWLGVKIGGVELSNATGFQDKTFAHLENAEVRIDTLSLLRMQPSVDKVVVHGLQINLARNVNGTTNWDDLIPKEQSVQSESQPQVGEKDSAKPMAKPSEALNDIKVGGIELRDAQLKWDDQQSKAVYEVQNLNVTISEIALGTPLSVEVAATLKSTAPALQANLTLSSNKIQWDLDQQHFELDLLKLGVQSQGETLPGNKITLSFQSPVDLHLQNQTASLSAMVIQILGIEIKGKLNAEQITANPAFNGALSVASLNPQQLFKALGIDPPQTADPEVLQKASLEMALKGNSSQLNVAPLKLVLDDTTMDGDLGVQNFTDPAINFKLDVDAIDVDRYLPPASKAPAGQSGVSDKTKPVAVPAEETPIPLEPLRALNMNGQLKVGTLTASKIVTKDLFVKVDAKNGLIHLKPVSGKVSGGSFTSNIKLDAQGEMLKVAVKESVGNVQVEPILKALIDNDLLAGAVNLSANIQSQGKTSNQLIEALQGTLDFEFNNGAIKGFNLAEYGRQGKALLKGQSYTPSETLRETDFTQLTGKARIKNGVVDNTELDGKSPAFRINGNGKVDLVRQTIDYLLTSYVVGTSKGQGGADLSDLKGLPIPVRIKGTYTNLDYDFDERAFRKAFTDKYKKQLKEKEAELKKEFEEKKKAKIEKEKQKLEEELKEKEDELKDKLKEKLKKLF